MFRSICLGESTIFLRNAWPFHVPLSL